jgi:chemotaxis protein histidine kinase CheA
MRRKPFLALALIAGFGLASLPHVGSAADEKANPKKQKQAAKKLADAKKAEEERQAAEAAKKAADAKRAEARKAAEENQAEPLKPARIGGEKDAAAVAKFIDAQVAAKLAAEKVPASPACTDEEFVRRAYLDLAGVIPTAEQAKAFLESTAADKRGKLIDELLDSPNYARHRADLWMALLVQRTSDNRRVDFASLRNWLDEQFAANKPWNEVTTDLLTSTGQQEKNPAVGFYLSNNTVDKMTDEVAKVFLGVQLQCAQCHDHKFNDWKQTDYWAMAQFFMKVEIGGVNKDPNPTVQEKPNVRRNAKNNTLPESAKQLDPKFLQGPMAEVGLGEPYRPVLAKWVTAPTNPFFAKATVNRVWAELFGRGIVNPVDDMVGQNLPSHPELLEALAADFAANGFDLKHLLRGVCNSAAYQRSSKPAAGNETAPPHLYAKMTVKILSPEQLFDSLAAVTKFEEPRPKTRDKAVKGFQPGARDRFVTFFLAGAEMVSTVEYEAGIPQALKLMNSKQTASGNPLAVRSVVGNARGAEAVEKIYLSALSRYPTAAERAKLTDYVAKAGNPQEALGDVLWAVLNSSEFTVNR